MNMPLPLLYALFGAVAGFLTMAVGLFPCFGWVFGGVPFAAALIIPTLLASQSGRLRLPYGTARLLAGMMILLPGNALCFSLMLLTSMLASRIFSAIAPMHWSMSTLRATSPQARLDWSIGITAGAIAAALLCALALRLATARWKPKLAMLLIGVALLAAVISAAVSRLVPLAGNLTLFILGEAMMAAVAGMWFAAAGRESATSSGPTAPASG